MVKLVRLASIAFAVFSTFFWAAVGALANIATDVQRDVYRTEPSLFQSWIFGSLPMIIYGLLCVLFCHWFARKIVGRVHDMQRDVSGGNE